MGDYAEAHRLRGKLDSALTELGTGDDAELVLQLAAPPKG